MILMGGVIYGFCFILLLSFLIITLFLFLFLLAWLGGVDGWLGGRREYGTNEDREGQKGAVVAGSAACVYGVGLSENACDTYMPLLKVHYDVYEGMT